MTRKSAGADKSSGNVFADIGVRDAEGMLAKAQLAARITAILDARGLSQTAAAKLLGVDQPKVSALYRGRLRDFSLERLMRFVTALHRDVRIVVDAKPQRRPGKVVVDAA
jgi:predicted XRE-type DNA-binding protein